MLSWVWVSASALILIAIGSALWFLRERPPESSLTVSSLLPPQGTSYAADITAPALSPDGKAIVFTAQATNSKPQLWLRRLDSAEAHALPGTDEGFLPFWSPDNRWIGFGQENKLKKVDVMGGPPLTIADGLAAPMRGGSWNREGIIVFSINIPSPILQVSASGGSPAPVTVFEESEPSHLHRFPTFLPDGRHFLYLSSRTGDIPVRVASLDEPEKPGKVVAQTNSTVLFSQGYLLYLRENTLVAHPFDVERLVVTGEAIPIAERVETVAWPSRLAQVTVADNGLLVYRSTSAYPSKLLWMDRNGKELEPVGEPTKIGFASLAVSPDDKSLAVSVNDGTGLDIWIHDLKRQLRSRFTVDPFDEALAVWSPDGSSLYWQSNRNAGGDFLRRSVNAGGKDELVYRDTFYKALSDISPDGKQLLFNTQGTAQEGLFVLDIGTASSERKPTLVLNGRIRSATWSPDAKWIAYTSDESGSMEVYVIPFSRAGAKLQVSSHGGDSPRWRRDGKGIFYMSAAGELIATQIVSAGGKIDIGKTQKLFGNLYQFDVSADGQKFIVAQQISPTEYPPLTLVHHWTGMLKK
jgi:Tol biopolymer transport system component